MYICKKEFECVACPRVDPEESCEHWIEVKPVIYGKWIDKPSGKYGKWQAWCSACNVRCGCGGTLETQHKDYCPNCGATMDIDKTKV